MPDEVAAVKLDPNPKKLSFVEFLETSPPDVEIAVDSVGYILPNKYEILSEADIHLECDNEKCDGKGELHFARTSDRVYLDRTKWKFAFVTYTCRNCRTKQKTFALAICLDGEERLSGMAYKFGELPAFGPQVPSRVISLIGPDRNIFLSGRRSENHGLGIGAFAYYRRVVENQKGRIIQEMAKVAKKLDASDADLKLFAAAAKEIKFSEAVDKVKAAIPSALLIQGHNPLTLLHKALSDGLHERSDAECLECAREIRLVLTDLAERMSQVLKEESELKNAVSKLLARVASKVTEEPGPSGK